MTKLQIKYYQDASHGWLAVKRKMLADMNIEDEISPYSYQKGATVYLEEDRDAYLFVKACKNRGIEIEPIAKYCKRASSPIRTYEPYST